ncbi:hypothetical protein BDR03DRAFT_1019810 [Suillus americanus]|nr:hypothetical protein BDR03DRAFT_1019810 [Suillus americanus]
MPGETHSTSARSKGINDLDKQEQIILTEALKSGTLVIKCGLSGSEDKDKSQWLLANGVIDHEGPSCLQPSAATTKVRKPNSRQAAPIASSIVVNDDSPTSTIVCQKNLIVSVEIPPARPSKVVKPPKSQATPAPSNVITLDESVKASSGSEEDDSAYDDTPQVESDYEDRVQSRKRKAKTTGGTHRLKRHVLSSDIEVIEPQPKGKGKDTALQKERVRAHYHKLTSESEEEQKPDEVKEVGIPLQL